MSRIHRWPRPRRRSGMGGRASILALSGLGVVQGVWAARQGPVAGWLGVWPGTLRAPSLRAARSGEDHIRTPRSGPDPWPEAPDATPSCSRPTGLLRTHTANRWSELTGASSCPSAFG